MIGTWGFNVGRKDCWGKTSFAGVFIPPRCAHAWFFLCRMPAQRMMKITARAAAGRKNHTGKP